MAMTKQDFIALAETIKSHNRKHSISDSPFTSAHLIALAEFCLAQNSQFNRERWLGFIHGENGPSGGKVKV